MCGGEDTVWKGRAGQHTGESRAVRRQGFCFPAPPCDLRQVTKPPPPLPLSGCVAVGSHRARLGTLTSGGFTRSPTPTFCVGQAITFHLILLNQIICVCQKCLFQKGFWALSENIQPRSISHMNLFSFRSVCCFLLCWITEELSMAQYFIFLPQECTYRTYLLHLSIFSFAS